MADISLKLDHGNDQQSVLEKTKSATAKMSEKMGIEVSWDGDTATLGGTGVKRGSITVTDTSIEVSIDLALMAKPMKSMIEGKIKEQFQKRLA